MKKKWVKGQPFVMVSKNFIAFAIVMKNKVLLMRGSSFRLRQGDNLEIYARTVDEERKRLIESGIVFKREGEENAVFTTNYLFQSISQCSSVILGYSTNGQNWMNAQGQSHVEWIAATRVKKPKKPELKVGMTIKTRAQEKYLIAEVVRAGDDVKYKLKAHSFPDADGGFFVTEKQLMEQIATRRRRPEQASFVGSTI